ncbi:MAG: hypothetical protein AMJ91_04480 [candidate division Zixibacteria bacterium SM23_73_3]|nr:MAG: hypothetical protein AMJ91_04480 [candidate division Zixibacteria bacterium SM23_73_3]
MTDKKEKVYAYVSTILLIGSFCSAGFLILGLGMFFLQTHPHNHLQDLIRPCFSNIFSNLLRGKPTAIVNLGILLMVLTPLLRVVVAVFSFLAERDFRYATIAFGVMLILLFTIVANLF